MILLGVTGCIAAYKAVEIAPAFLKAGEDVHAIMTPSATHFVGPLTFRAISGHPVFSDALDPQAYPDGASGAGREGVGHPGGPRNGRYLSIWREEVPDLVSAFVLAVPRRAKSESSRVFGARHA